jgi:hypothetical protein
MRSVAGEPGIRIFLSYAREDERIADALVAWLRSRGFEVFWDQDLSPGVDWAQLLAQELGRANCLLVLWTKASIQSQWVRNEADEAMHLKKLWPVLLEPVRPPLSFRHLQGVPLEGWVGDVSDPRLERLARTLDRLFDASDGSATPASNPRRTMPTPPTAPTAPADDRHRPEVRPAESVAPGRRDPGAPHPARTAAAATADHPEGAPPFPFPESLATGSMPAPESNAGSSADAATPRPQDGAPQPSGRGSADPPPDVDAGRRRRRIIVLAAAAGVVFAATVATGLSGWRPGGGSEGGSAPATAPGPPVPVESTPPAASIPTPPSPQASTPAHGSPVLETPARPPPRARPPRCDRLLAEQQIRALRADEREFLHSECR